MGITVVLLDACGRQVVGLLDPSGGTFDAAGDLDGLLDRVPDARVWSTVDPHRDALLDHRAAAELAEEIPLLREVARSGPERRGLDRLAALTARCQSEPGSTLSFLGD